MATTTHKPANNFRGALGFLSNMRATKLTHEGIIYPSVEHAYQAAKSSDVEERQEIARMRTPVQAKIYGNSMAPGPLWHDDKMDVMLLLLRKKFFYDGALGDKLLGTGSMHLEECNEYGDRFWGTHKGQGENHLGQLLMRVRSEIGSYRAVVGLPMAEKLRLFWRIYQLDIFDAQLEIIRMSVCTDHVHSRKLALAPGAVVHNCFGAERGDGIYRYTAEAAYGAHRPALFSGTHGMHGGRVSVCPVATWVHMCFDPKINDYAPRRAP